MSLRWLQDSIGMTFRVAAISLGGYGLTSALCLLFGMLLMAFGISLPDAMLTTILLGYIFYIALVMWAFADRKTYIRPCLILVFAALTMSLTSYLAPLVLPA